MKVKCPTCGNITEFAPTNVFRPFCSERCQTVDLGAWADEQYKVPVTDQEFPSVNEKTRTDGGSEDHRPPKHQLN